MLKLICVLAVNLYCVLFNQVMAGQDRRQVRNLLSIDSITESYGVIREQRLFDGRVPADESRIDDFTAALFLSPDAFITFDLKAEIDISTVQLISLSNFTKVERFRDGVGFQLLPLELHGRIGPMNIWTFRGSSFRTRFLRLMVQPGIERAAVSEFLVSGDIPEPFPVTFEFQEPPTFDATVKKLLERKDRIRIATLLIAIVLILILVTVRRSTGQQQLIVIISLVLIGALGWTGFGTFHGDGSILHPWEIVHYYLGSKYFQELGYTELYRCIAAHERESGRGEVIDRVQIRNLDNNQTYPGTWTSTEDGSCRAQFEPERWDSFGSDADQIRRLFIYRHFHRALSDHGYNAAPLQTVVLSSLLSRISPSRSQLLRVAFLDFLLIALSVAAIWWAFGPLAGAASMVFIGLGYAWNFSWTGGSIGRFLWFALLCCGLSLLRKKHHFWGGFLTAAAGLLRFFPLTLLGGLVIYVLRSFFKRKRERQSSLLALGIAISLVIGVFLPALTYGPDVYKGFMANSRIHAMLPPGNHIGLGVLCSSGLGRSALSLNSDADQSKDNALIFRRSIWILGIVTAFFLLVFALRSNQPLWQLVPLSSPLLFASIPLSGYDYVWMVILVPLAISSTYRTVLLFAFVALTNFLPEVFTSITSEHLALSAGVFLLFVLFFLDVIRTGTTRSQSEFVSN